MKIPSSLTRLTFAGVFTCGVDGGVPDRERDRRLTARERAIGIGVTVAVPLFAAAVETYLVPHR